ncbi:MDR family MFS transporter [Paenibacillus guangzhouensis]|uniref:MDR family MFS transporter n=1 Tax=Paenibacillus guangzhouensis TaxID=1473112 RepID=UPI00126726A8|nr:MFS transporter [Paenibacillus guangzhouensis]
MDTLSSTPLLRRLSLCAIVLSTGLTLVWPINTIYMHEQFGGTISTAGLVLLLNSGAAFVGNLVGGILFDRMGGRLPVLCAIAGSACTVAAMGFAHDLYSYAVLLTLLGLFSGLVYPILNAMAVTGCPGEEQRAVNILFVSQNVGMALGAALGGFVANLSFQFVFLGNALLYMVFFVLFASLIRQPHQRHRASIRPSVRRQRGGGLWSSGSGRAVITACIGFAISWLCYSQWSAVVPLHAKAQGISFALYSLLWTVNGGLILLSHPLKTWLIRRFQITLQTQIRWGTFFFTAGLLLVGFADSYPQFVLAMVIMTCGEVLVFPAVPAWMVESTDEYARGKVLGACAASSTVGRMLGPWLGGLVYEGLPGHSVFTIAAMICLVTIWHYRQAGRHLIMMVPNSGSHASKEGKYVSST